MGGPYRIEKTKTGFRGANDEFKDYLSRLLKLIPTEIVGLYMIGSGFIPPAEHLILVIWSFLCLIALIVVRIFGTRGDNPGEPSQPVPVAISALAYVVWIYWLGGPFLAYGIHVPFIGSLAVLFISFIIPYLYKG